MEREADQCADICDILTIAELDRSSLALAHVVQMLEAAHEMFRGALDVFLSRDVEAATGKVLPGGMTTWMRCFPRLSWKSVESLRKTLQNVMC